MDFTLWNRAAVGQLIERECGITLSVRAVGGTREKLSMISTVTNQGKTRWMIVEESFNADKLIEFLAALVKDADRKVFLILDNLRVHHSKLVKAWLMQRDTQFVPDQ